MAQRSTHAVKAGRRVDLAACRCPETYERLVAALAQADAGDILEVVINDAEQAQDVPEIVKSEGHRIVEVVPEPGRMRLRVRKGEDESAFGICGRDGWML